MLLQAQPPEQPTLHLVPAEQVESREASRTKLIWLMIVVSAIVLFAISTVRHYVLRSGAFDLGFFDQAVWLISKGETPISSLHRFHVLADHASIILYPISILYLIYPNPQMLLALQALALAGGAWPIWKLARLAGLRSSVCYAVVAAYLMYPLLLTSNLFDFHPDVIAVPALLMAILSAKLDRKFRFCFWLLLAVSCKEILSLTVVAMGMWLLIADRKKPFFGLTAIIGGTLWFVFTTKLLIPYFGSGRASSGMEYYSHLGNSLGQILSTFITRPMVVLKYLLTFESFKYIVMVLAPLAWGLHRKTMLPLLGIVPAIMLNMLSNHSPQRSPFFQYSLPVVPFMFMAAILALSANVAWLRSAKAIIAWSVALLVVGVGIRAGKMHSQQALDWETMHHTKVAIERIGGSGKVLTTFETVPHLSQRTVVEYIGGEFPVRPVNDYDYILLSTRHSSLYELEPEVSRVLASAASSPAFHLDYSGPDVFLFKRSAPGFVLSTLTRNE